MPPLAMQPPPVLKMPGCQILRWAVVRHETLRQAFCVPSLRRRREKHARQQPRDPLHVSLYQRLGRKKRVIRSWGKMVFPEAWAPHQLATSNTSQSSACGNGLFLFPRRVFLSVTKGTDSKRRPTCQARESRSMNHRRSLRMIPGASIHADRWQADQQTTIDR